MVAGKCLVVYTKSMETKGNTKKFIYNDGGRAEAGYKGYVSDCVIRAITIAGEYNYTVIYQDMSRTMERYGHTKSGRNRIPVEIANRYMSDMGFRYVTGVKGLTLDSGTFPQGRIVLDLEGHVCAMLDGVVNDNWDWTDDGKLAVLGYWVKK